MSAELQRPERVTIVLHSGDMDKVYSALIIGSGALAMGMEASIYFTFWGLQRLKKSGLEGASLQDALPGPGEVDGEAADEKGQRRHPGAADAGL